MIITKKMDAAFSSMEHGLEKVETKALNNLGYVPVLGTFSAVARAVIAKAQFVSGLAIAIITGVGGLFAELSGQSENAEELYDLSTRGIKHVGHGLANFARAILEAVPFLPWFTTLEYDWVLASRIGYSHEESSSFLFFF